MLHTVPAYTGECGLNFGGGLGTCTAASSQVNSGFHSKRFLCGTCVGSVQLSQVCLPQSRNMQIRLTGDLKWPQMLTCLLHNRRDQTQRAPRPSSEEKMDEGWLLNLRCPSTVSSTQLEKHSWVPTTSLVCNQNLELIKLSS